MWISSLQEPYYSWLDPLMPAAEEEKFTLRGMARLCTSWRISHRKLTP
jgi:hypothetical protein